MGAVKTEPRLGIPGHHARPRKDPQLPESGLRPDFQKRNHHRPHQACWAAVWSWAARAQQGSRQLRHLDNLRWSKVIICTDADVDGYQIRTLVLTMLYRLTPTLIEQGLCLYRGIAPVRDQHARTRPTLLTPSRKRLTFLRRIDGEKYTIQRSKGLGENDPEMMWLTTMSPESAPPDQGNCPTDAERTAEVFDLLLGDNLAGPQGAYRRTWRGVSGRAGRVLTDAPARRTLNEPRHGSPPATAVNVGPGRRPHSSMGCEKENRWQRNNSEKNCLRARSWAITSRSYRRARCWNIPSPIRWKPTICPTP